MRKTEINKPIGRTELSDLAKSDLDEIWSHLNQSNPAAADKLIKEFVQKFKMLAENPKLGRSRNEFLLDLRSFPFKKYIIFYLTTDFGIEIFRVIHGARNIESIFDTFFDDLGLS